MMLRFSARNAQLLLAQWRYCLFGLVLARRGGSCGARLCVLGLLVSPAALAVLASLTSLLRRQVQAGTADAWPLPPSGARARSSAATTACLIEQPISYAGRQHLLSAAQPLVIGRDGECCTLVLSDLKVARCHAEITFVKGRFVIRDLQSLYGTYVNNRCIESHVLNSDDLIHLGDTRLVFVSDAA